MSGRRARSTVGRGSAARAHGLSGAAAALVAVLLLAPVPSGAIPLAEGLVSAQSLDKVVHFLLFPAAAPLWMRSFWLSGRAWPAIATILCATTYAGLLEVAQEALTATRSAEWGDLLAGALGGVAGVAGAWRVDCRSMRRPPRDESGDLRG